MINELKFQEFFNKLEGAISSVIIEINQDNLYTWKEDYITDRILIELRRNFRRVLIKCSSNKFIQINANFLKFNGKLKAEKKYGDIAIIVKLYYDDDVVLEGVGLIEAKRIYKNSNTFEAVNLQQIDRIYKHSPHAFLMLYDYNRIDNSENFKNYLAIKKKEFPTPLYAALVPINLVYGINKFDRSLYRFSIAFSYQFAYRYIYGLDLDFSDNIIKTAKGYEVDERYLPEYIIQISVNHTRYGRGLDLILPEVNSNNFNEIE